MITLIDIVNEYQAAISKVDVQQHEQFNRYAMVYHSNAIENSTLSLDDTTLILEHQLAPSGKPLHDILMAKDHYDALVYVLDLAKTRTALSHEVLRTLAAKILKNTGGIVRHISGDFDTSQGDYRTVIVRAGESIFPKPKKVFALMNDLIHQINENINKPITLVEKYHLSFDAHFQAVSIHPFGDGNGRFSRLLMNYIQEYHGLPLIYPFVEDKQAYFNALVETRKANDIEIFRAFMTQTTIKFLKHQIELYQNYTHTIKDGNISNGKFLSILY